jgi:hypothetical protein
MKRDQLARDIGWVVKLAPSAIHLDRMGRELPSKDEDWVIVEVTNSEVRIDEAAPTGLTTKLGIDAVASFTSDPSRSDPGTTRYGLLLLKVQMYIKGEQITFVPCLRPGELVPPRPVRISELSVDTQYPVTTGLQRRLEAAGYRTSWAAVSRLASLQHEGWDVVVEPDQQGMPTSYHLVTRPENMVYIKTREPDLGGLAAFPCPRKQSPGSSRLRLTRPRAHWYFGLTGHKMHMHSGCVLRATATRHFATPSCRVASILSLGLSRMPGCVR